MPPPAARRLRDQELPLRDYPRGSAAPGQTPRHPRGSAAPGQTHAPHEARQHQAKLPPRPHHAPTGITSRSNTGRTRAPAHLARPVSGGPETVLTCSPESGSVFPNVMVGALTLF